MSTLSRPRNVVLMASVLLLLSVVATVLFIRVYDHRRHPEDESLLDTATPDWDVANKHVFQVRSSVLNILTDATRGRLVRMLQAEVLPQQRPDSNRKRTSLPKCARQPDVYGKLYIDRHRVVLMNLKNVEKSHTDIEFGGHWRPRECEPTRRIAIVIALDSSRRRYLAPLLYTLLPILKRQQVDFTIFTVEQTKSHVLNKGILYNAAVTEMLKDQYFSCFIFHDVDLLPTDDRNLYSCARVPRHMSTATDYLNHRLPYNCYVGGVLSISAEHFLAINGFSNEQVDSRWQDDSMAVRLLATGIPFVHSPSRVARYISIATSDLVTTDIQRSASFVSDMSEHYQYDGLNTVQYTLLTKGKEPVFTQYLFDTWLSPRIRFMKKAFERNTVYSAEYRRQCFDIR